MKTDAELKKDVSAELAWDPAINPNAIGVGVKDENGWVRLQGEVEWEYQRRAVEKAIRPLTGVVGISNEITLEVQPKPADLAARIEDALKRQALREAKRVDVSIDGTTVTLRGQVHSWQERDAVQGAAWSAPGVLSVINEVRVGD